MQNFNLVVSYTVYILALVMEKQIVSARVSPKLGKALKKEALKAKRTLSYYIEELLEEIAKEKKIV